MGALYQEFEKTLAEWGRRWSDKPREEMLHLFLLALEREEIVAVGYRENAIARRLGSLEMPADVRELVRHSLIWAWKDEEMHAIYIRGAIIRLGNLWLKTTAYVRQLAGGIGGWSSSVLMHTRWREAPLSRTFARVVTSVGGALGNVPPEVRASLEYGSFRQFCEFNVDAEMTAWSCWRRIRELAEKERDIPRNLIADFSRIEQDEDRHRRLFELLAEAFDDQDRLVPHHNAETIADRIAEIGEEFLPRRLRPRASLGNPLGGGGRVHVIRGDSSDQKRQMFDKTLKDSGLLATLDEAARRKGKQRQDMVVAIKPTFMLGYTHKDLSAITDPELLEQLARYLKEAGVGEVQVVEAPNIYEEFYQGRGVREVAGYFRFESPWYRLIDASEEQVEHRYARGMAQHTVSRSWKDADFRISFGKMRSHPVELAYLTLANVEWIGARCDQFLFCERQAQRETAIMMLLDASPPHFAILEAWEQVPDGLVGVMGCRKPRSPLRFYAGKDALAVDVVAARHMGVRDPRESSILRAAFHWFGADDAAPEVVGTDEPITPWRGPYHNEISTLLSLVSYPMYVLGSGRGKLFVPEMDETAFPSIEPPSLPLRVSRRVVQAIIGLRLQQ